MRLGNGKDDGVICHYLASEYGFQARSSASAQFKRWPQTCLELFG